MNCIVASASEETCAGATCRVISIEGRRDTFFACSRSLPKMNNLNFVALATVFFAMQSKQDLHIEGPISRSLLRNLEEFQEAWSKFRPIYEPIEITAADEINDMPSKMDCGAFAFSAGVDSTFTLLRHLKREVGRRSVAPTIACMIHGFDIGLEKQKAFSVAEASARNTTQELGVELAVIRTNWIKTLCTEWTSEFAAGISACLNQFSGITDCAVMGADEDYASLFLKWGSNPVTNPMLPSTSFPLITDGAGFTRTQRIAEIAKEPKIASRLRVCWQGDKDGVNCGKCEKCIRTKLNFIATGHEPSCFPDGVPTALQIINIQARGRVQRDYLREILRYGTPSFISLCLALAIAKNIVVAVSLKIMRGVRVHILT